MTIASSTGAALEMAGVRSIVVAELMRRGMCDLARLAGMTDRELKAIPNISNRTVQLIRALIESA